MADKRLDIMYIPMTKQEEDSNYVWYKFSVKIYTQKYELDQKGEQAESSEWPHGVIKFKKNGSLADTVYEIIKEETSPDLFQNVSFEHIIWGCLYKLVWCKRNGTYPESMTYQCG
jgi:hypothetical protein